MTKSNWKLITVAIGAVVLIACWQLSLVDAYQRRGARQSGSGSEQQRGGAQRGAQSPSISTSGARGEQLPTGGRSEQLPAAGGERGGGRGGDLRPDDGGADPARTPQDDDASQSGAQGATVHVHNHYYSGGGNTAAAPPAYGVAPGVTPAGYVAPAYDDGSGYGQYGPGTGAINLTQAQNQSIENHNYAVQSYYANKDLHDQYVAAHRKTMTPEERAQIQHELSPGRLSSVQYDRTTRIISWPQVLQQSAFNASRQKIDHLFHSRSPSDSGKGSVNYEQVDTACREMKDTLTQVLRADPNFPAVNFCVADHFIRSVDYEAEFEEQ